MLLIGLTIPLKQILKILPQPDVTGILVEFYGVS